MKNKRNVLLGAVLILSAVLYLTPAFSQEEVKVTGVTDKLFMIEGIGGNVGFLVTDEGVVVVDAGTYPELSRPVIDIIKEKTDKPIKYLLLTHYHYDHTFGIKNFPDDVIKVSHVNLKKSFIEFYVNKFDENVEVVYPERIKDQKQEVERLRSENSPDLEAAENELNELITSAEMYNKLNLKSPDFLPDIMFRKRVTFEIGGEKVEMIFPGNAHTDGSAFVYFPGQKAVHMGDLLFHEYLPYIDIKAGSNTANWIDMLEKTAEMDLDFVIPGHGELTSTEGLYQKAEYLRTIRKAVVEAYKKGLTLEEMKDTLKFPQFENYGFSYLFDNNIEAVYSDISKK